MCGIEPDRDGREIIEHAPHVQYLNVRGIPLHPWGSGPFCAFRVPADERCAGVYVIAVGGAAKYVGECENLAVRFNNGYGSIAPRACFVGGQSTNCRVNSLILAEAKSGCAVE